MSSFRRRLRPSTYRLAALAVGVCMVAGGAIASGNFAAYASGGTTVYVSTGGSDSNNGLTPSTPVQTLAKAQQVVEGINGSMSADITVQLAGGTYRLASPLTFTSADSGTNGYSVNWTAAPNQTVVISGADKITGWTAAGHGIFKAAAPSTLRTRQIYVNGARAYLASGPPPVALKRTPTGYRASTAVMSTWANPTEIEFVYPGSLGYMVEPVCPVASISGKNITMAQPCWDNSNKRGAHNIVGYPGSQLGLPAYIQGALPLLTQPGQFYLDNALHELYYMPRPGQNMATADVEAPALQSLVQGNGTSGTPITNLSFSNIQFSGATWMQPDTSNGFSEEQSGYFITGPNAYASEGLCHTVSPAGTCPFGNWDKEPGAVQFTYDQNLTFSNDVFVHLGGAALNLDDGSQNDTVSGSVFTDISGNGIELGNVDTPQATGNNQTTQMMVNDNYLYDFPVEFHGGVPIIAGYVNHSTIAHNDVHDIPWAAISLGWGGWLDKTMQPPVANNDGNNLISDNLVYNFMEGLKDGGGIYTQGIQGSGLGSSGLTVSGNVIHDQLDWGGALKSDDGTTNVTYSNNVLYNNFYDWDGPEHDYRSNPGHPSSTFDPEALQTNYWQQGDFMTGQYPGITESSNSVIAGTADAPAGIVNNAGLEPAYSSLLSYQLDGAAPPSAPQMVSALYAFKGKAWITWHPSYDAGSSAVTTYTIQGCKSGPTGLCIGPKLKAMNVSAATLNSFGFAVYGGLSNGKPYAISVTAHNSAGASIPSLPAIVTAISKKPHVTGAPSAVTVRPAAGGRFSLIWTAPKTTKGVQNLGQTRLGARRAASVDANGFVLGYVIKVSNGAKYSFNSHNVLVETNTAARVVYVVKGLTAGKKYSFSVYAVNPAGTSKPTVTKAFAALP